MSITGIMTRTYRTYRKAMWLSSVGATVLPTVAGYAVYAGSLFKQQRDAREDNPELAADTIIDSPWDWLTRVQGWIPTVARILLIAGLVALLVVIACAVVSFVAKRTSFSGVDRSFEEEGVGDDEDADDYDSYDDYDERDYDYGATQHVS